MANFKDLPLPLQMKIYRLHLLHDEPVTPEQHDDNVRHGLTFHSYSEKHVPPILHAVTDREDVLATVYYGENMFDFRTPAEIFHFKWITKLRHLRLIRRVTCDWNGTSKYATEVFRVLGQMKSLEELVIRTEEKNMLRQLLYSKKRYQRVGLDDPSPQQQLLILQFPGMLGLLSLSGIRSVRFAVMLNAKGEESGGPIPGGVLETLVAPRLMGPKPRKRSTRSKRAGFPFLSLPPELRNRVYDLLLRIPGPVQASTNPASSAAKSCAQNEVPHGSSLNLLAVNRQIHDEAIGIFYGHNSFIFHYPIHLHGFLQSLGPQRQKLIRDITVHYENVKSGGMSLIDLTFALLRNLTGLKRLEVVLHGDLTRRIRTPGRMGGSVYTWFIRNANPGRIPGMKALFALRGIEEIRVRDLQLEEHLRKAKRNPSPPDFADYMICSLDDCHVQLGKVLEHFNLVLMDAQEGNVNHELLEDDAWHMQEVFPASESA